MAVEETDQALWDFAVENVTDQQEEAWDSLFNEAVEEHLKGECPDCNDELCSKCEERITTRVEQSQESHFDYQVEAEYGRLLERQEEQETE